MNTTEKPVKPKLTPEERIERWWSKRPLPFYVKRKEKHFECIYLIQTREDLLNLAMAVMAERHEIGYYGRTDDYFSGTYEEYVVKKIGFTVEEAEALLMQREHVSQHMQKLKDEYMLLRRWYNDDQDAVHDIRRIENLLEAGVPSYAMVDILSHRSSYQYEGFEIERFEQIPG